MAQWGSLTPKPRTVKAKVEETPEVEVDTSAADNEAASQELSSVMDGLGEKMAAWTEAAKPKPAPKPKAKPNPVAKSVDQLTETVVRTAAGQLELGLEVNAAVSKAATEASEKASGEVSNAIANLSKEIAKAAEKKPELTEAVRVIGETLGKRIEAASKRAEAASKDATAALKAEKSDKPLVKAIEALTGKIEKIVAENSNSGDAIKSLASAITLIETKLETISKQKQVKPEVRKPVPYRFTIGRNPETQLLETCLAEPLAP